MEILDFLNNEFALLAILISFVFLFAYSVFLHFKLLRLSKYFGANKGGIDSLIHSLNEVGKDSDLIKKTLANLEKELNDTFKAVHVEKFNPFSDTGHGKQSFVLVSVNKRGNGFLLSTLALQNGTHIFIKEIREFGANQEFSEEEKIALEKVKQKLYNP